MLKKACNATNVMKRKYMGLADVIGFSLCAMNR